MLQYIGYKLIMLFLHNIHPSSQWKHWVCQWIRSHSFSWGLYSLVGSTNIWIIQDNAISSKMKLWVHSCLHAEWRVTDSACKHQERLHNRGGLGSEQWAGVWSKGEGNQAKKVLCSRHGVTKAHLCLEKTEYSEDSLTWGL